MYDGSDMIGDDGYGTGWDINRFDQEYRRLYNKYRQLKEVLLAYKEAEENADTCGECRSPYNFCGCCWDKFVQARSKRETLMGG